MYGFSFADTVLQLLLKQLSNPRDNLFSYSLFEQRSNVTVVNGPMTTVHIKDENVYGILFVYRFLCISGDIVSHFVDTKTEEKTVGSTQDYSHKPTSELRLEFRIPGFLLLLRNSDEGKCTW